MKKICWWHNMKSKEITGWQFWDKSPSSFTLDATYDLVGNVLHGE